MIKKKLTDSRVYDGLIWEYLGLNHNIQRRDTILNVNNIENRGLMVDLQMCYS